MKFKIDECLPKEYAHLLAQKGYDAETVFQEGLCGHSDAEIWLNAQQENRFLITCDLDFSDIRFYKPGKHAGILLFRLKKEGRNFMLSYFNWLLSNHNIDQWQGCFVIATDHKIRVKIPR